MASCGYCGAARQATANAAKAFVHADFQKAAEQAKVAIENIRLKAQQESDRIRGLRGVKK